MITFKSKSIKLDETEEEKLFAAKLKYVRKLLQENELTYYEHERWLMTAKILWPYTSGFTHLQIIESCVINDLCLLDYRNMLKWHQAELVEVICDKNCKTSFDDLILKYVEKIPLKTMSFDDIRNFIDEHIMLIYKLNCATDIQVKINLVKDL